MDKFISLRQIAKSGALLGITSTTKVKDIILNPENEAEVFCSNKGSANPRYMMRESGIQKLISKLVLSDDEKQTL